MLVVFVLVGPSFVRNVALLDPPKLAPGESARPTKDRKNQQTLALMRDRKFVQALLAKEAETPEQREAREKRLDNHRWMKMPAPTEAPASFQAPRAGIRVVVRGTFIEVVEGEENQPPETAVKRALSAPVLSFRREEEAAHCLGSPADLAQQSVEVEDQVSQEPKTTVAIRNIPLDFTRDQLQQHLDAGGFAGQYDILFSLPANRLREVPEFRLRLCEFFRLSSDSAQRMLAELDGCSWGAPGEELLVVSWSLTQGLDEHVERYRNSPLMHESMLDDCRPIVLQGGARAEFPPPTTRVHRLRRLRTRCGSRGRGVSSSGFASSMVLHGLTRAPSASDQQAAILASPLLAGLRPASAEASGALLGQRREQVPGARGGCSTAVAPARGQKAAWADLQDDDLDGGCSECSTRAPSHSGTASSDGHGGGAPRDGPAVGRRGSSGVPQPWTGSLLAQGLMPALLEEQGAQFPSGFPELGALVEVVGTFPSGGHAVVTAVDREKGTCKVQLMQDGRLTRRVRTIKCKYTRPLRREEMRQ
ncbi:unnamed protein product [Prorocentrum cordatum]|uniref:RRM domain-containing protein n=1 Tax=Prorocentrum cordatum TaxID=2364126 RepID=A0ABN9WAR4_9DINO|nr:unnamed protein product [Polarella glacialis]